MQWKIKGIHPKSSWVLPWMQKEFQLDRNIIEILEQKDFPKGTFNDFDAEQDYIIIKCKFEPVGREALDGEFFIVGVILEEV